MATVYSDQLVRQRAGRNLQPYEWLGKQRTVVWDFASLAAGNIGDVLVLGRMLKDDRIVGGWEMHSAGGAGTYNLGTYLIGADNITLGAADSAARFISGGSNAVSSAPTVFPIVLAGANFVATQDVFLCITNVGTAFTTSSRWTGGITLVRD